MKIKMKHPKYFSGAEVVPEQIKDWESKGWVAEKETKKKDKE